MLPNQTSVSKSRYYHLAFEEENTINKLEKVSRLAEKVRQIEDAEDKDVKQDSALDHQEDGDNYIEDSCISTKISSMESSSNHFIGDRHGYISNYFDQNTNLNYSNKSKSSTNSNKHKNSLTSTSSSSIKNRINNIIEPLFSPPDLFFNDDDLAEIHGQILGNDFTIDESNYEGTSIVESGRLTPSSQKNQETASSRPNSSQAFRHVLDTSNTESGLETGGASEYANFRENLKKLEVRETNNTKYAQEIIDQNQSLKITEGFVWKLRDWIKVWAPRFLILHKDCLSYYRDNNISKCAGRFLLVDIADIYENTFSNQKFAFTIDFKNKSSHRSVHLATRTLDEAIAWVKSINKARARSKAEAKSAIYNQNEILIYKERLKKQRRLKRQEERRLRLEGIPGNDHTNFTNELDSLQADLLRENWRVLSDQERSEHSERFDRDEVQSHPDEDSAQKQIQPHSRESSRPVSPNIASSDYNSFSISSNNTTKKDESSETQNSTRIDFESSFNNSFSSSINFSTTDNNLANTLLDNRWNSNILPIVTLSDQNFKCAQCGLDLEPLGIKNNSQISSHSSYVSSDAGDQDTSTGHGSEIDSQFSTPSHMPRFPDPTATRKLITKNSQPIYCHFTGFYFCEMCMHSEPSILPIKILSNWDWQCYPVSFIAHRYLNEAYKNGNQIKISLTRNQNLYNLLPSLLNCFSTKEKLHKMVTFVDNCRLADTRTCLFAKDEDFIESYTLQELKNLKQWSNHYKKLIEELDQHVEQCPICQGRGFICELCALGSQNHNQRTNSCSTMNKTEIIFSFTNNTTSCDICSNVYHASCYLENCEIRQLGCPKCLRLEKRRKVKKKK